MRPRKEATNSVPKRSIKIKRWILVQDYETIGVHVRTEGFFVVIMRRHALRLQHSLLMA
jgi:hypothetical protein